jgi:hypothetical protein
MYPSAERRGNRRDRITTEGVIWHDHPYSMIICTVRDASPAGACLLLPDKVSPLPSEFDLIVDRVTRRCILVWQQISRAGVKFEPI